MIKQKPLYIGLNGYAGSGKDTVAKMLKTVLSHDWDNIEQCKTYYKSVYTDPTKSATYNPNAAIDMTERNSKVLCIAYADQLKTICSTIFGITLERFYMNKNTAWVCINHNFEYTEHRPEDEHILTADEYYYGISDYRTSDTKYWLSLREILVYVGTYVLQQDVNKHIFINIVRNKIKEELRRNNNLNYIIVTDNRFYHELEYIRENNGITMTITRNGIQQLDNIAEHELDDIEEYDYTIDNSGTYDDLFEQIWNITHDNVEFHNITVDLNTRDSVDNYLRLVKHTDETDTYKLCAPFKVQQLYHNEGEISMVDPVGGPRICLNQPIDVYDDKYLVPEQIYLGDTSNTFLINVDNNAQDKIIHIY